MRTVHPLGLPALFLILFLLAANEVTAEAVVTNIAPGATLTSIGEYATIATDPDRKWTIEDATKPANASRFKRNGQSVFNLGYSHTAYWVRWEISRREAGLEPLALVFEWPHMDLLEVFIFSNGKLVGNGQTSRLAAPGPEEIESQNPTFVLPFDQADRLTVFARFYSDLPLSFPVFIQPLSKAMTKAAETRMFLTAHMAVLMVMALYNLFLFLTLRDRSYFLYVAYVVSFTVYSLSVSGLGRELWSFSPFLLKYAINLSAALLLVFLVLFVREFLKPANLPAWVRWINIAFVAYCLLYLIPYFFIDHLTGTSNQDLAGLLIIPVVLISSGAGLLRGYRPSAFLLFAFVALLFGLLTIFLRNFQILPNNLATTYGMQIGSALEVVLLSLALADRIAILRRERSEAQQQALAAREEAIASLERASKIKDEFLANTSHELRTPLQGIISIVENVEQLAANRNMSEIQAPMEKVRRSATRLSHLVNDLLDYSRIKEKGIELHLVPLDIAALVHSVCTLHEDRADSKGMTIEFQADHLPLIPGDEERLIQIIENLVSNAIKFTSNGSILVRAFLQNGNVLVSVRDTGPGVPDADQSRIFEPFEQAEGGITRRQGGTGLGLSISRSLARAMGGDITVKSSPGMGSTFTLMLPIHESTAQAAPRTSSSIISGDILLVDDEPLVLEGIANQLSSQGYSVHCASHGREAMELLADRKFDAVLLDVMMPEISGLEVCKWIRARYSLLDQPVLLLTARSRTSDLAAGIAAGANDFLVKPFESMELLHRISLLTQLKRTAASVVSARDEGAKAEQERIYADLHDKLGAKLTDLRILSNRLLAQPGDLLLTKELARAAESAQQSLRNQLLHLEDLRLLGEDFGLGLHLLLLRRYTATERTCSVELSNDAAMLVKNAPREFGSALYPILEEIASNDLKYGSGHAFWRFSSAGAQLQFWLLTKSTFEASRHGNGRGTFTLTQRTAQLNGTLSLKSDNDNFELHLSLPVPGGQTAASPA